MTDYQEEQANEIEALVSIYPDELQIVSESPFHSFRILVTSQCSDDIENATCILQFTYTASYPDEDPIMEILSFENIEQEGADVLMEMMKAQCEELRGMVMIFSLVSAVQEKLSELVEQAAEREKQKEEERIQREEEAERKKFEGTLVTIETFLAWKAKFDAEISETTNKGKTKSKENNTKPTGRELFLLDHTLDDSDVKFLEEEGGTVAVDESLFQDMDDLDLDDEDFDLEACGGES